MAAETSQQPPLQVLASTTFGCTFHPRTRHSNEAATEHNPTDTVISDRERFERMESEELEYGEIKKKNERETEDEKEEHPLPLMALNHVSRLCGNVKQSLEFYTKVLGFVPIERPQALDHLDGAWLFNYGIGVHLVQADDKHRLVGDTHHLDAIDNHISFQCEDVEAMEQKLKELGVKYMKRRLEDDGSGTEIEQLFFNDPDGFMIEICNCENLKLVPLDSSSNIKLPPDRHCPPLDLSNGHGPDDADFISPA